MYTFSYYFLLFFLYSFIGWLIEIADVLIEEKELTNRGFFIGPYVPIHGAGALTIILYTSQYKDNPLTVFLLAFIICSVLEYITSYLMEKLFNARWWDYSNFKFNLNGRICLRNSVLFGVLGLLLIYTINPFISNIIEIIPTKITIIISLILFILFTADIIISFKITGKLKKTFNNMNIKKDNTTEIKEKVFKTLKENKKHLQIRILKSFPNLNLRNKK